MIRSFRSKETKAIYEGKRSRQLESIRSIVERKLAILDAATQLDDLRYPPGNRLESLAGDRKGQYFHSSE